jgi:hypothetical protein
MAHTRSNSQVSIMIATELPQQEMSGLVAQKLISGTLSSEK